MDAKPNPVSIVCCYAPTNGAETTDKDEFYDLLQHCLKSIPSTDYLTKLKDLHVSGTFCTALCKDATDEAPTQDVSKTWKSIRSRVESPKPFPNLNMQTSKQAWLTTVNQQTPRTDPLVKAVLDAD